MNADKLQAIKERVEKAIGGPWDLDVYETERNAVFDVWFNEDEYASIHGNAAIDAFYTADFIAHARQDIPELVAEIERLRLGLEAVQSQLVYTRGDSPREDSNITGMCIRIRQLLNGEEVDW